MIIFFVISFITNIIGPIIPEIIQNFNLSLSAAGLLPFAFFIAYAIFSIPSGYFIEIYGEKKIIIVAFIIAFIGSLFFSFFTNYLTGIISLLLIGAGMSILQVAINPLLRSCANAENFAFYSILGQLFFGLASFLSPILYIQISHSELVNNFRLESPKWIVIYWIFCIISLVLIFIINLITLPTEKERKKGKITYISLENLLKNKWSYIYFFAIFFYVGTEQGINTWASQFFYTYHNIDPQTEGARVISNFWGNMTIGTLLGLMLIKLIESRILLIFLSILSIVLLTLGLFGDTWISLISISTLGLSISSMWSIIIALALNSFKKNHGALSGILMTGISGGAIYPLIIGSIGDFFELRVGLMLLYLSLVYILFIGYISKPKILNKKLSLKW